MAGLRPCYKSLPALPPLWLSQDRFGWQPIIEDGNIIGLTQDGQVGAAPCAGHAGQAGTPRWPWPQTPMLSQVVDSGSGWLWCFMPLTCSCFTQLFDGLPMDHSTRFLQSVTLEPGGQFELSGATLDTLHKTCAEVNSHLYQAGACLLSERQWL